MNDTVQMNDAVSDVDPEKSVGEDRLLEFLSSRGKKNLH